MSAQIPDFFPPLPFRVAETTLSSSKATNWSALQTYVRRNNPSLATTQVSDAITKLERNRKIIIDTLNDAATSGTLSSATAFQTRITESFITTVVKEYLELLFFAQAHFPLSGAADEKAPSKRAPSANNVVSGLQFTWTVFGEPNVKNSTVKGNTVTSTNANFEASSILINAALCWGRIAQQQVWQYGTEGAKTAFKYFQAAAGIIAQLSTLVGSLQDDAKDGEKDSTEKNSTEDSNNLLSAAVTSLAVADLSPRGLAILEKLFLACAHHCGYLQAVGKMSTNYTLLAKMAMDGCNMYKQVVKLIQDARTHQEYIAPNGTNGSSSGPTGLNTEHSCMLAYVMLEAKAQHHLSHLDFQDKPDKPIAPGSGVGRLNRVLDLLEYAQKSLLPSLSGQEKAWCNGLYQQAQAEHAKAMKDIELVHMGERILKSIPEPEANNKPLGKPTPSELYCAPGSASSSATTEGGVGVYAGVNTKMHDPFFGVVPLHILGPVNDYRNKVRTIVSQCSESLGDHKKRMRDKMTKMGVGGAIQLALGTDGDKKSKLPKDMRSKIFLLRMLASEARSSPPGSRQNSSTASNGRSVPEDDTANGHLIDCLVNQLDHGNNVADHVQQRLVDMLHGLEEERHEDQVKMTQYGNKLWRNHVKPADTLPEGAAFQRAGQEFLSNLKKWVRDPLERSKSILQSNLQDVARLDWAMVDLDALMPFMEGREAKQQTEQVKSIGKKLQEYGAEVDGLVAASERTLADLRILVDSDNVAYMLSCAPKSQHSKILDAAQQDFTAGINQVSANRNRIDALCDNKIANAMEELAMVESNDALSDEVRALCRSLETSITTIEAISEDILMACKYADTLSEQVEQMFEQCQSFVVGRKMEAEELAREIDNQVSARIAERQNKEGSQRDMEESKQRQEDLLARIRSLESGNPPTRTNNNNASQQGGAYASAHSTQPQFSDDGFPTLPPSSHTQPPPQHHYQQPQQQQSYAPPPQQQQQQQQGGGWWQSGAPTSVNQGSNPNVRY